jgi:diaminobutyrate-2-oxoglutarate transaminase
METDTFEKYESEVRSYCRKYPKVFTKSKGSYIYDEDGNKYLDFFCGAGALNYGHNNDFIKERLIKYLQDDGIIHALDMYTVPKREFIDYFENEVLIKRGLNYKIMFPAPTGTNAIEAAIKLARKVKKRNSIFALMGAFHGMTLGALALTTDKTSRGGAGVPLDNVVHIPAPYMFPQLDTIEYMEKLITDDHSGVELPAAIVIETVQAEGGVYVMDVEWLKKVRELCNRYDILLIVDDIQIGCCRTGTFFSFERAGIVPDMVVLSKSIGGYGMPFALTLFKPELDIWKPAEHNGTFRGYQLSMVAAKAGLEFMLENHIEEQTREKGKIFEQTLRSEMKEVSDKIEIRGIGLFWGVDFSYYPDGTVKKIITEAFKNGLIFESAGRNDSVVKLLPPLTINEEEIKEGLSILKNAAKKVLAEV